MVLPGAHESTVLDLKGKRLNFPIFSLACFPKSELVCKPGYGCSLGVKWTPVHFLHTMPSDCFKAPSSPSRNQYGGIMQPPCVPTSPRALQPIGVNRRCLHISGFMHPAVQIERKKAGSVILCLNMDLTHLLCCFLWAPWFFEIF